VYSDPFHGPSVAERVLGGIVGDGYHGCDHRGALQRVDEYRQPETSPFTEYGFPF
jgi:hypothetical protein